MFVNVIVSYSTKHKEKLGIVGYNTSVTENYGFFTNLVNKIRDAVCVYFASTGK